MNGLVYLRRIGDSRGDSLKFDLRLHFCLVEFQGICFLRHAKLLDGRNEQI